jgi:hypothetical protein
MRPSRCRDVAGRVFNFITPFLSRSTVASGVAGAASLHHGTRSRSTSRLLLVPAMDARRDVRDQPERLPCRVHQRAHRASSPQIRISHGARYCSPWTARSLLTSFWPRAIYGVEVGIDQDWSVQMRRLTEQAAPRPVGWSQAWRSARSRPQILVASNAFSASASSSGAVSRSAAVATFRRSTHIVASPLTFALAHAETRLQLSLGFVRAAEDSEMPVPRPGG